MNLKLQKNGLIAAALMNIFGVLIFSRLFTNSTINQADSVVMSNFGLLMIVVWGLAYLGASQVTAGIKWLLGVFIAEKLVYVVAWCLWMTQNSLTAVYAEDLFAGIFFSIYGLNDFVFMLFFIWAFFYQYKMQLNDLPN